MFVPTELTYAEVVIAMIGLFIAGFMAKKRQATKRLQREQKQRPKDSLDTTSR